MFPLPRLKDGIGRQQLAVSLAMLAAVCLTGLFVVYQVSMALDSAVLLMIGAIGLGIVFAAFWGVVLFDQWPDQWTVIGALVIVGAGLYVWHRETLASRPR